MELTASVYSTHSKLHQATHMNTTTKPANPEVIALCIKGIRKNIESGKYPQGSQALAEAVKAIEILTEMEAKARKG